MENFQRFVRIGDDRINVNEIISYGLKTDEDDDTYLYIDTKSDENVFAYYEDDLDVELEEKLGELDGLLLIRMLGHVDFRRREE